MLRRSWWVLVTLAVACAGVDDRAPESRKPTAKAVPGDTQAASGPERLRPSAPSPDTPEGVVIALIEAFQAGDQTRVEELWARDGGTWTNAAGFRARAAAYQDSEFDLAPESITVSEKQGIPQVIVKARQDGQDQIWSFFITEMDGKLRAGGVEVRPVGMP